MFAEERRNEIARIVNREGRVLAGSLAEKLNVSIDTIRRDLSAMEDKGLLKRTHGGAINAMKVGVLPSDTLVRLGQGNPKENAVAKLAASFINEGDTVFISGSGIGQIMAGYLSTSISFSVVTNSIYTADRLKDFDNIKTYLACGRIRKAGYVLDALTVDFIMSLRLDTCFLDGDGLSAGHGLSAADSEGAVLVKAIAEASKRKICLATFDKLGYESFYRSLDVQGIDMVITDSGSSRHEIEKLRSLGTEVLIAD